MNVVFEVRRNKPVVHKDWLLVDFVAQLAWEVEEPEDMSSIFTRCRCRGGLSDGGRARPALGRVTMRTRLVSESGSHGGFFESGHGVIPGLQVADRLQVSILSATARELILKVNKWVGNELLLSEGFEAKTSVLV